MNLRQVTKHRKTRETDIRVDLNLDGAGESSVSTGIAFFDHMLAQVARHGYMDITIEAKGDLEIDGHHTVEDIGWVLGQALREALGDSRGIVRFAHAYVPLDEALSRAVVDLSGRPYLVYKAEFNAPKIGELQPELIEEFFKAFVQEGRLNLHIENLYGRNQHHIAETIFKAAGRALHLATRIRSEDAGIPSTKGVL